MKFEDKTILVVGSGKSGVAAVKLLAAKGSKIILLEGNAGLDKDEIISRFDNDITFDLILGDLPDEIIDKIDIAVLSPGVPTDLPFVIRMQESGIPIWGEIELAYRCGAGRLFAITGTN